MSNVTVIDLSFSSDEELPPEKLSACDALHEIEAYIKGKESENG